MKRLIFLLSVLISLGNNIINAQEPDLKDLLLQLDEAVAERDQNHQKNLQKIAEMKATLEQTSSTSQYEIAAKLMEAYKDKSTDSAFIYANRLVKESQDNPIVLQNSKLHLILFHIRRGDYTWAEHMLEEMGKDLYKDNAYLYYQAWDMLRTWQNESHNPNNEIRNSSFWWYADSLYKYRTDPIDIAVANAQMNIYANTRAAIDTLMATQKKIGQEWGWRYIGKRLGLCYQELEMRDSAEYYFALSALADMHGGVVEHTSLHLLSLMLLEDGDIDRAYHYTKATLEDANLCRVRLRIEQVSRSMPKVLDAYYDELALRQRRINAFTAILAVLLLIASVSLYYIHKTNKRLKNAQEKERNLNEALTHKEKLLSESLDKQTALVKELSQSNKTKEVFVGQYMRQCINNIQQLEHYRLSLQKVAAQGNMDKIIKAIKKNDFIEKEMENFYQGFDETFLHIFPHFVEDFNALLREDCRIVVPEGKLLTVDLRIHALIRLGLTETEEIAKFLHYSPQTIYNYRSRIRSQALNGKEEFEKMVKEL